MKKNVLAIIICIASALALSSCGSSGSSTANNYLSPTFKVKAQSHRSLAVLPFDVITTGSLPEGTTDTRKRQMEEDETKLFQQSLYNGLTNNLGSSALQIQAPNKTNNLLISKGVNLTQVSKYNPEELAKMLGVDAVVFATVTKYRYLDDKSSMGISTGKKLLGDLSGGISNRYTGGVSSKTNDVKVTCSIVEAKSGDVLWKTNGDKAADWSKPSNEVIDKLNQQLAVNFPYRNVRIR